MKRFMAVILVLAAMCLCFAGCGKKGFDHNGSKPINGQAFNQKLSCNASEAVLEFSTPGQNECVLEIEAKVMFVHKETGEKTIEKKNVKADQTDNGTVDGWYTAKLEINAPEGTEISEVSYHMNIDSFKGIAIKKRAEREVFYGVFTPDGFIA